MRFITGGGAYEFLIQGIAHRVQDVEADEVTQRERPHGVPRTAFHTLVDVLPAGHPSSYIRTAAMR
jgi:hypothetical protein